MEVEKVIDHGDVLLLDGHVSVCLLLGSPWDFYLSVGSSNKYMLCVNVVIIIFGFLIVQIFQIFEWKIAVLNFYFLY